MSEVRARILEPDGREVILLEDTWTKHVAVYHPDMAPYERAVMETVTHPDHREPDERPGRERFFAQGKGPARWLRVVVDFTREPGEVVTAFGQRNEP